VFTPIAALAQTPVQTPTKTPVSLSPCLLRPLQEGCYPAQGKRWIPPSNADMGVEHTNHHTLAAEVDDAARITVMRPEIGSMGQLYRLHADPALTALSMERNVSPELMYGVAKRVGGRVSSAILTIYTDNWPIVKYFQQLQKTVNETLEKRYSLDYTAENGTGIHVRGLFNFNVNKVLGLQVRADLGRIKLTTEVFRDGLELRTHLITIDEIRADLGYYRSFLDSHQRGAVLMFEYSLDR
jgi:hypothetical protein